MFQVLGRLTGDGEAQLSHRMAAFWSQFAATGNPTPSGTAGETVVGWLGIQRVPTRQAMGGIGADRRQRVSWLTV